MSASAIDAERTALRVLVVVHGIGDQTEFATLQQLVNLCLGEDGRPDGVPIGKLHSLLRPAPPDQPPAWATLPPLQGLGFAEVFWADIGRQNEKHVLEDTVSWADTIAQRLEVIDRKVRGPGPPLKGAEIDRPLVQRVLGDVALGVRLARLLNQGLTALGLGSVDLEKTLVRFLGDVQLFAEFASARAAIMARFHAVMQRIEQEAAGKEVEIHICGHSQGSVVAFLGLLEGYAGKQSWLRRVRTFMTIGSPIDKFLILWPELFNDFARLPADNRPVPPDGIRWWNYADLGDPVGYELDTAAAYVRLVNPVLFAEDAPIEREFRRYLIPGKAHIEYWNDQELFNEWLGVVVPGAKQGSRPKSRTLALVLAPLILFLVPALFAVGAAYAIASAIHAIEPLFEFDLRATGGMALLVLGTVALAGSRSTSKNWTWVVLGLVLFGGGGALAMVRFGWQEAVWPVALLALGAGLQMLLDVERLKASLDRLRTRTKCSRTAGPRRTVVWIAIALALAVTLAVAASTRGVGVVFGQGLRIAVGVVCWALAVLTWELAVAWIDYVSGSKHMERLRKRWGVPDRRQDVSRHVVTEGPARLMADARSGLWWQDRGGSANGRHTQ